MRTPLPLQREQQGFTLIEVLVAILILSFGMLGLVGMQAFALQSNREARLYSQAINYARELAEMMRGNNQVATQTSPEDNPYLFEASTDLVQTDYSDCLKVSETDGCSSTIDVAEAQMKEWLSRVSNALPGAQVAVCFDKEPFDSNGKAQWECTEDETSNSAVAVIKIGWNTRSTDQNLNDSNALVLAANNNPQVVIPVTGGNPFGMQ